MSVISADSSKFFSDSTTTREPGSWSGKMCSQPRAWLLQGVQLFILCRVALAMVEHSAVLMCSVFFLLFPPFPHHPLDFLLQQNEKLLCSLCLAVEYFSSQSFSSCLKAWCACLWLPWLECECLKQSWIGSCRCMNGGTEESDKLTKDSLAKLGTELSFSHEAILLAASRNKFPVVTVLYFNFLEWFWGLNRIQRYVTFSFDSNDDLKSRFVLWACVTVGLLLTAVPGDQEREPRLGVSSSQGGNGRSC